MCFWNKNLDHATRVLRSVGLGLLANGLILRMVLHPPSAGAQSGVHFVAGFMVGMGSVFSLCALVLMRRTRLQA